MPDVDHPSPFNPAVLEAMADTLREWALPIHDPFAGPGDRLGALADQLGLEFSGSELERPFIVDRRVRWADATDYESYPPWDHCVATSPVYPNGMTDHFNAQDGSTRHTYRQARAAITGRDEPLHGNNMGRYGPRGGKAAETAHWVLAQRAVRHWPERVIVNIKDCYLGPNIYPAVARWHHLLAGYGYEIGERVVETRGQRHGANREARVPYEVVLICQREGAPT
jgi:hypothetical protein